MDEQRRVLGVLRHHGFFSLAEEVWRAWAQGRYILLSDATRSNLRWMGVPKAFDRVNGAMWLRGGEGSG